MADTEDTKAAEADVAEVDIAEVDVPELDAAAADIVDSADTKPAEPGDAGPPDTPPLEPVAEEKPRGRTSLATKLLVVFNLLATLGLGYLLYLDVGKRQDWARAVFLRDLAILGLPLDDSDMGTNPEAGMQPNHDLDPPLIKDAYVSRGGKPSDKFLAVAENFKAHIDASDLDDKILARYFSEAGVPGPVKTRKKEIDDLKVKLPGQVDKVAQSVADKVKGKPPGEKRELLKKILFPLCTEGWQAVKLNEKIESTPDPKLDEFLTAAAKRRLWFDILQPMEIFRPSENLDPEKVAKDPKVKNILLDRAADLDDVKVEDLKNHFVKRCADVLAESDWIDRGLKRDSSEKRRSSAFLLLAASQAEVPGAEPTEVKQPPPKEPPKAPEDEKEKPAQPKAEKKRPPRSFAFDNAEKRAKVVCGLYDFNQACEDLAIVNEILEKQTVQAIARDLGNFSYPGGSATAIGFLGQHQMAIKRIQDLALLYERREYEYKKLQETLDGMNTLYDTRVKYEEQAVKKLLQERASTRQLARELKELQDELFVAQVNLAGVHAYNLYLAKRLEQIEKKAKSKGGAGQ